MRIAWALGAAYSALLSADHETNLRQAIACCEAALQVFSREAFPAQWAATQLTLGLAYSQLLSGDRQANLSQAIACYEAASQVFSMMHISDYAQMATGNLEVAKGELQKLNQPQQLTPPVLTHIW